MEWVKSTNEKQVSKNYLRIFINGLANKSNVK